MASCSWNLNISSFLSCSSWKALSISTRTVLDSVALPISYMVLLNSSSDGSLSPSNAPFLNNPSMMVIATNAIVHIVNSCCMDFWKPTRWTTSMTTATTSIPVAIMTNILSVSFLSFFSCFFFSFSSSSSSIASTSRNILLRSLSSSSSGISASFSFTSCLASLFKRAISIL